MAGERSFAAWERCYSSDCLQRSRAPRLSPCAIWTREVGGAGRRERKDQEKKKGPRNQGFQRCPRNHHGQRWQIRSLKSLQDNCAHSPPWPHRHQHRLQFCLLSANPFADQTILLATPPLASRSFTDLRLPGKQVQEERQKDWRGWRGILSPANERHDS